MTENHYFHYTDHTPPHPLQWLILMVCQPLFKPLRRTCWLGWTNKSMHVLSCHLRKMTRTTYAVIDGELQIWESSALNVLCQSLSIINHKWSFLFIHQLICLVAIMSFKIASRNGSWRAFSKHSHGCSAAVRRSRGKQSLGDSWST